MNQKKFLNEYSGQSIDELIKLEEEYRVDSIVYIIEKELKKKIKNQGKNSLNKEELILLSIFALEREVNNGGYDQFLRNSSNQYANIIIDSLKLISCPKTADITREAFDALNISGEITVQSIENTLFNVNEKRKSEIDKILNKCDNKYYKRVESPTSRLFDYIKRNKDKIKLDPLESILF